MNGFICSKEEFEDTIEFIKDKIIRIFYNVKNGLRNLWKWRSVVWNDRPWDYVYIFKALRFKLDETQKCIDGNFVGSEEEASKMRSLIEAIDRIIEDDYVKEEYEKMDRKYGKLEMIFNNDNSLTMTREHLKEEDKETERKETLALAELEAKRRQQDINFVFDTMKNDIQRWWV
jgi:hypothetical protein